MNELFIVDFRLIKSMFFRRDDGLTHVGRSRNKLPQNWLLASITLQRADVRVILHIEAYLAKRDDASDKVIFKLQKNCIRALMEYHNECASAMFAQQVDDPDVRAAASGNPALQCQIATTIKIFRSKELGDNLRAFEYEVAQSSLGRDGELEVNQCETVNHIIMSFLRGAGACQT
ncbi:hypothetical protein PWT90_02202 [Aphanocladium album]|nr:hypothetical protein PWT90_02202 [Aphanocladium album]